MLSTFNGKVRLLCAECMFADPDLIKEQKDHIMPLSNYIYKLYNLADQTSQGRESLRSRIPVDILNLETDSQILIRQFEAVADEVQDKIEEYLDQQQRDINKIIDDHRTAIDNQIKSYKNQMKANLDFVVQERDTRYYRSTVLDEIQKISDLEEKCQSGNAEQLFEHIETLCKKELMDKDTIDDYCALLYSKFISQGEIKVDMSHTKKDNDHPAIVEKLKSLTQNTEVQLKDIRDWIDGNLVNKLKVCDISKGINFEKFKRSVSQDGYSGFVTFDLNQQVSLGLVDKILCPKDNSFTCLTAISIDYLAAGCQDGNISLYRIEDGNHLGMLPAHNSPISAICWMRDKQGLPVVCTGTSDTDSNIVVTSVNARKTITVFNRGHSCGVSALLGLDDGRTLFSGGQDGMVCLWDLGQQTLEQSELGHRLAVTCLRICEQNDYLLSGGRDNQICIWSLSKEESPFSGKRVLSFKFEKRVERSFPICNIIPRQALGGIQIIVVENNGLLIEVINIDKMIVEETISKPYPDHNFIILEHSHKDGDFDFSIVSTLTPSDEEFQRSLSGSQGQDHALQINIPSFMPRAQLINHFKNRMRLAKIAGGNMSSNFINIYDVICRSSPIIPSSVRRR